MTLLPSDIEAMQFEGNAASFLAIGDWMKKHRSFQRIAYYPSNDTMSLSPGRASKGDWIIRLESNVFAVMTEKDFMMAFEEVKP